MIVELRTCVLHPGRQAELLRLMAEQEMAIERLLWRGPQAA
jgi:hypothetical protein